MSNLCQRFDSKWERSEDGCWLWNGATRGGYGAFKVEGRVVGAHRVAFELYKGGIPDGFCVCHSCDVKLCVNPEHLFAGTHSENSKDAFRKNLVVLPNKRAQGENNGLAATTAEQVKELRRLYETGNYTQRELGELFGLARRTVGNIVNRDTWQHV